MRSKYVRPIVHDEITPASGLWLATSEDGRLWKIEDAPNVPAADPGAVPLPDGGLLVIATSGPRPGTPSARRRGPPR